MTISVIACEAFEAAIKAAPLDPTNYLVFADFLEERGEQAQADELRRLAEDEDARIERRRLPAALDR